MHSNFSGNLCDGKKHLDVQVTLHLRIQELCSSEKSVWLEYQFQICLSC